MSFLFNPSVQTYRMPINPLDRATIVSVYPREIIERKPTISPGLFCIPAAPMDGFSLLVVGPSSWWRFIEENQPLLEIPTASTTIAESVIRDYMSGLFGCDMGEKIPGLFYIPGEYDEYSIFDFKDKQGNKFQTLLDKARERQKNWFAEVVKQSDVLWARTQGNPLAICDDARMAAEILGLDKPWMQDFKSLEMQNCPACGSMVNPMFPVCANCKAVINKEKAVSLGLEFVK